MDGEDPTPKRTTSFPPRPIEARRTRGGARFLRLRLDRKQGGVWGWDSVERLEGGGGRCRVRNWWLRSLNRLRRRRRRVRTERRSLRSSRRRIHTEEEDCSSGCLLIRRTPTTLILTLRLTHLQPPLQPISTKPQPPSPALPPTPQPTSLDPLLSRRLLATHPRPPPPDLPPSSPSKAKRDPSSRREANSFLDRNEEEKTMPSWERFGVRWRLRTQR